jgi:sugar phosphate isomerase/epimerase
MRFAVFTASTPDWTPVEAAATLAAQGWDGIEWRVTDQEESEVPGFWAGNRATWPLTGLEENLDEMRRVTTEVGLEFSGIGAYAQASDHENVERVLAATAALGAPRVRVTMPHTGTGHYRELFARTRADLEWVAERATRHGVQAVVELHHGTIVASASAAFRLVDGLDPARVGVIHDTGNLVREGQEDYLSAFELLGEYLAHVHVKNTGWWPRSRADDGTVGWEADWATLRAGQVDFDAYFTALARVGYDGWVTLEDFSTELPLVERTADGLAYLRAVRDRAAQALARG